jgi:hypothetical protein
MAAALAAAAASAAGAGAGAGAAAGAPRRHVHHRTAARRRDRGEAAAADASGESAVVAGQARGGGRQGGGQVRGDQCCCRCCCEVIDLVAHAGDRPAFTGIAPAATGEEEQEGWLIHARAHADDNGVGGGAPQRSAPVLQKPRRAAPTPPPAAAGLTATTAAAAAAAPERPRPARPAPPTPTDVGHGSDGGAADEDEDAVKQALAMAAQTLSSDARAHRSVSRPAIRSPKLSWPRAVRGGADAVGGVGLTDTHAAAVWVGSCASACSACLSLSFGVCGVCGVCGLWRSTFVAGVPSSFTHLVMASTAEAPSLGSAPPPTPERFRALVSER